MEIHECPCGGRALPGDFYRHTPEYKLEFFFMVCPVCKCRTGLCESLEEAVKSWNSSWEIFEDEGR